LEHPGQVSNSGDLIWRRVALVWSRGDPGPTPEDDAICTFDIANITAGGIDGSWTPTDYDTCDVAFRTFATGISLIQNGSHVAKELRYYRMQFASPMTELRRFVPSGPPEHIEPLAIPGTGIGDTLPLQVAFSVTERTAVPRHWGRFYLPGMTDTFSGGGAGRWTQQLVNTIVAHTDTLYASLAAAEFFPVVVSTQVDKVLAGSLMGVTYIQADDIPDVIRRRRSSISTHTVIQGP